MSIFHSDVPGRVSMNNQVHSYTEVIYKNSDIEILRHLATTYAEIARLPVQKEKAAMWQRLNDLEQSRPLVMHNEICWHEMNVDEELNLNTSSNFCRRIESELKKTIYLWKHMPADMVVTPTIYSPLIIENSGIGYEDEGEVKFTDENSEIVSKHFKQQIKGEEDIERIKTPIVCCHKDKSEEFLQAYKYLIGNIVNIETTGPRGFWFAPWDDIVTLMGVQETLTNLALEPELMHKLIDKITNAYLKALDQYEEQGLLSLNTNNYRVGSGAYGYTNQLPLNDFDSTKVRSIDIWGSSTPQIFGEVSPAMHNEFGIEYEKKWLERFGLSYYGCCEPLHNKIDILKRIKNLRKISISPWADKGKAAEKIQRNYVISLKPSPTMLASETWDIKVVQQELKNDLEALRGCNVEIVIKDISTVRYKPERLWQWVDMATRLVQNY